jgi:hypothetical protein
MRDARDRHHVQLIDIDLADSSSPTPGVTAGAELDAGPTLSTFPEVAPARMLHPQLLTIPAVRSEFSTPVAGPPSGRLSMLVEIALHVA